MRKIYSFLLLFMCVISTYAQQTITTVQGRPYDFGKSIAKAPEVSYQDYSMDDIEFWVGEGSNRALFVVQFNDPRETNALVWGYRFDGDKRGIDVVTDIARADPRLYVLIENADASMGYTICGIGYDADGDGDISLTHIPTGQIMTSEDGVFNTLGHYDYDDYTATDPDDFFGAGWYQSYWSYWVKDGDGKFGYSGLGASSRVLKDGSWDGWNFAVGMNPQDFKPFKAISAPGYNNGTFFIGNEKENGAVNYLSTKNEWENNIYQANNNGLKLNSNILSGTFFGNNLYIVSGDKDNNKGNIIVAESNKLVNSATIADINGRAFVGVTPEKGYVSTDNGIYAIDLTTMTLGDLVTGTDNNKESGKMICAGKYVFAVQDEKGIIIIDSETNSITQTFAGNFSGIAQSGDGYIWAAGSKLIKIDPASLIITNKIELPEYCKINESWDTWNAGKFIADPKSNTLYWTNGGFLSDTRSVYRYNPEENSSLASPFFSLPNEKQIFSSAGICLNTATGQLVITAISTEDNSVFIYYVDAKTGVLANTIEASQDFPIPAFTLFPDKAPVIKDIDGSITVPVNNAPIQISLQGKITDEDNVDANITVSVISENPEIATAELKGNTLIITPLQGVSEKTTIILSAVSNGKIVTKKISLTINRELEGISMEEPEITMKAGSTKQLNVIFTPANATNQELKWSYENYSTASVDSKGLVSAKKEGTTTITAKSVEGNFTATCKITIVNEAATGIALNKTESNIYVNRTDTLDVIFTPEDASTKDVTWTVEDPTIASMYAYYKAITGKKEGTTKITATSKDGNFTAECIVNVTWNPATKLKLDKTSVPLQAPNGVSLTATFEPSDASNKDVVWSSEDETIATVSSYGSVKAVGQGTTTIKATSKDDENLFATCTITATFIPVESIAIPSDTTIAVSKSATLRETILPDDASNKSVEWSSSDESIATVSQYGSVKGIKAGTVTITATTVDGSKTANCNVTVVESIPVTAVTIAPEATIKIGKTTYITRGYLPSNTTTKIAYTFKSDNEEIATVDQYGNIKGIAPGNANVTIGIVDTELTATCFVHVVPNVESVAITPATAEIIVGDQLQLQADITPAEALQGTTWDSSDKSIATVDENGVVTALKAGNVIVTATSSDDNKISATAEITVKDQLMTSLAFETEKQTIEEGEGIQLATIILPENTTDKRVRWTTSDYTIATVTSFGYVKAISQGDVTINAISQDGTNISASCEVTVKEAPSEIEKNVNSYSIYHINNELVIDNFSGYTFRVYSVRGDLLKELNVTEEHTCFPLNFATGVYIIKGNNGTNDIATKIIIQ